MAVDWFVQPEVFSNYVLQARIADKVMGLQYQYASGWMPNKLVDKCLVQAFCDIQRILGPEIKCSKKN